MLRIIGLFFILLLPSACASETNDDVDPQIEYALSAIEDNILTTDYTAMVEIIKIEDKKLTDDSTIKSDENLLVIQYSAEVLESYSGKDQASIVFAEYVEASEGLEGAGTGRFIVSLCKDRNGEYYLPDIGYELPAHDDLVKKANEIKSRINNRQLSVRRAGDDYACKY